MPPHQQQSTTTLILNYQVSNQVSAYLFAPSPYLSQGPKSSRSLDTTSLNNQRRNVAVVVRQANSVCSLLTSLKENHDDQHSQPAHSSAAPPVDANRAPEELQTTLHLVSITCHVENHEPIPLGLQPRRQHYVPQLLCGRLGDISCTGKHTAVEARQIRKGVRAQLFQDWRTAQLPYQ